MLMLPSSSSRRWTSFSGGKFWPSQRHLSISLDPWIILSHPAVATSHFWLSYRGRSTLLKQGKDSDWVFNLFALSLWLGNTAIGEQPGHSWLYHFPQHTAARRRATHTRFTYIASIALGQISQQFATAKEAFWVGGGGGGVQEASWLRREARRTHCPTVSIPTWSKITHIEKAVKNTPKFVIYKMLVFIHMSQPTTCFGLF